ncbi:tyrosine-type recombinase/integrase [Campylobacter corcagiensis]|uniref:Site-specific integrase n=1 Tax=Campylobacter corcagiensis TaxID=1448857 RepID=A0A7M1LDP0_9BACT|nr:site-specific integrase [Campylobacter corcagiensis]QKF65168.1 site-specific tyrosine recombinase, phage integrase family (INT_Rci_Hp1_C domain) [Campylobacter corcagiensis]QOQ86689.1 site-specific integrase [Campylobacter corcagiensis]
MALKSYNKVYNTTKFPGIKIYIKDDNDIVFYMRQDGKDIKIGSKSEGVNITYAFNKKKEFDIQIRNGELPDSIAKKYQNKNVTKFNDIAYHFFNYKLENNLGTKKNIDEQIAMYEMYHKNKFGNLQTNEITSELIEEHYKSIKEIVSPKTKRKLSQSRINSIMGLIRTIFNHAIKHKLIKHLNPFSIEIKKPDNKRERFLEKIEIELLREEIKKKNDFDLELFIELALCTGARLESVLSIRKKDLSLSARSVNIIDFKAKNTSNKRYTGFLSDEVLSLINQIYNSLSPNDLLINKPYATVQNVIQPLLNKLFNQGLENDDFSNRVVIHTLRHTFASHLAIKGTPILTIKKLMNHSDISHTLRYAKLAPDSGKDAIKELYN